MSTNYLGRGVPIKFSEPHEHEPAVPRSSNRFHSLRLSHPVLAHSPTALGQILQRVQEVGLELQLARAWKWLQLDQ